MATPKTPATGADAAKTPVAKKPAVKKPAAKKVVAKKTTATKTSAEAKPEKKTLTLESLTEMAADADKGASAVAVAAAEDDLVLRNAEVAGSTVRGRVPRKQVTLFMRQLIMLLEAGTPILRSLKTLSQRGRSAALRGLVTDIAEFVEQGNPLWQAFDRHPRYFTTVEVNLIKASEASGTLIPVLRRIADQREARALLAARINGALIYPVMLVLACVGVLIILTKLVVPAFEDMFAQANMQLNWFTEAFLKVSNFCGAYWYWPIIAVLVLLVLYKGWYVRNPVRRITADRLKLHIPIYGPRILQKRAIIELHQTLAMLLRSGLSMMASLDLTRNSVTNRAVAEVLQSVRDSIEQGGGMEAPLRAVPHLIPPEITDMLVTGEESGRVDAIAEHIAKTKEEELKIDVSTLGEALQPIFTLVIGLVVIVLFIALFLPIIGMVSSLTQSGV